MAKTMVIFFNIFLAALLAGTMFAIWIGYNPMELSQSAYTEQQQNMIRQLYLLMPLLGLITIILTIASAFLQKHDKKSFVGLLTAATFLIISGLITRIGNQPINDIVMGWSIELPPGNWTEIRDKWFSLHIIRTLLSLAAFCLIIGTGIKQPNKFQRT